MAGYQAKSNNGNDSKSNRNDNNKNSNNSSVGNSNPSLKDNLKQKGASGVLQALGIPKPIADFGAKQAANGNLGKKTNPAQVAKQHDSSKKKDSGFENSSSKDKNDKDKGTEKGNNFSNAKSKLGKAKEGINNLKNLDEDSSSAQIFTTFIKSAISIAPLALLFLPILLIIIVITSIEVVYGSYNNVDNLYQLEKNNSSNQSNTSNNFYAPIQGVDNLNFGSVSSTAGCNNNVSHDVSNIPEGTLLYAGLDGKAEFIQISCGDELYSYGNEVRITSSDGTYIIYGHLKQFVDGVQTEITKTCPKKDGTPPCPSSSCSNLSVKTVDTKDVKAGDVIGQVGNTGNSTNTHLHVEIHKPNTRNCVIDPWKSFGLR